MLERPCLLLEDAYDLGLQLIGNAPVRLARIIVRRAVRDLLLDVLRAETDVASSAAADVGVLVRVRRNRGCLGDHVLVRPDGRLLACVAYVAGSCGRTR
jgi:hypothetical protein